MTPEEVINMRDIQLSAQSNIRSLWQDAGDFLYPYVNITSTFAEGTPRTRQIYDMTPMLDAEDMISGLKNAMIPAGQNFFAIKVGNDKLPDNIQRYISMLTEAAHEQIFNSNFVTEFDEVLRSLIIFGPASIFSEWTKKTGLNYRSTVIGTYQFIENAKKLIDGIIMSVKYTPKQAIQEFGEDKVGRSVQEANKDPKKANTKFEFIYLIQPRELINQNLSQSVASNMPWEQQVVAVKDKITVMESGFPQFPYHSARWKRPANEVHGRGIGTEMLPQIKVLDRMNRDFNEVGNKFANPAIQKHSSVEGPVRTYPGGQNTVRDMGNIAALGLEGSFPIAEASLERQTDIIDRAFFKHAFSPLDGLTGDRRTTLEIRERIKQTWHKIGPPVARIWYEMMTGLIQRSILLLIRNGAVEQPPAELEGIGFGLEFVSPFALELKSQQARAFQEWAAFVGEMDAIFPGATDNVDPDDAIMRMGRTFGVNVEDMASEEQRDTKRELRQQKEEQQLALQMAQVGGQAYQAGTKAPEEGSPAEALMGAS